MGIPVVGADLWRVGQLAAEHLLSKGYTSLAALGGAKGVGFEELFSGFREAGTNSGVQVREVSLQNLPGLAERLGGPLGLLAPDDLTALAAMQVCRENDLIVPDQVGVLGVGDRAAFCEFAETPVSSIDCGAESIGYKAAERLHTLMSGEAGELQVKMAPQGISERSSTQLDHGGFRGLDRFSCNRSSISERAAC